MQDFFKISLEKNPAISVSALPGHFTTSNSHVSHYLDVSELKFNAKLAQDVARELAIPYLTSMMIDTIVCMEKTAVIGGFLAEEFLRDGTSVMNTGNDIHVIIPTYNSSGKLIISDNVREWVARKNILLLVSSVSSGRTVNSALEFISYYGGNIAGVSSLFTALPNALGWETHSLFTSDDIPGFKIYNPTECEMCKSGMKLDALVSHEGYSKILF